MTLDGFLTALTLIVAIFALVPAVQRLRATLSLPVQGLLALAAFGAILWLELYEPTLECPFWLGTFCTRIGFGNDAGSVARKYAFLVVLVWALAAYLIHRFSRVSIASVPALARLTGRLIDENRLGEALALLEPHIGVFAKASLREGRWQHFHDRVQMFGWPDPLGSASPANARWDEKIPKFATAAVRPLAKLLPAQRSAQEAAIETLRLVFHSPQVLAYIANERPDLALPLLRTDVYGFGDFADAFLERLIARPGSALYRELEQNQNTHHPVGYYIPESNRLLHLLFSDAEVALKLGAWRPVGNYLQRLFDGAEDPDYIARLNGSAAWFESEWWRDPGFVGIFYFDVMVSSALHQGVRDHMWLFYFPNFADRIAQVYDSSGPGVDRSDEFPTRGARLLYELVSHLAKWIRSVPELPEGARHRMIPADLNHTGDSIPFSAANALGRTLAAIMRSGKVDLDVIQTLHDVIARLITELPREGILAPLRARVIAELVSGGGDHRRNNHVRHLSIMLENADHVLRAELDDYRAAFEAA